jgi:uncharacterized membrane protein YsdA (DUF1294 family)
MLLLLYLLWVKQISITPIYLYTGISIITFLLYAVDKSAAVNNRWRIPENTLHMLALLGGWIGAVFAQQLLRHKTKKQPFRMLFLLMVVLNICFFVYFFIIGTHLKFI